jgi:hypothetical protein
MTTPTTPAEMADEVKRLALAVRIAITRQCLSPTAANVARCDEADAALRAAIDRLAALAAIQVEPAKRVYIVQTGVIHEGLETYTRHDDAPPPLCDSKAPDALGASAGADRAVGPSDPSPVVSAPSGASIPSAGAEDAARYRWLRDWLTQQGLLHALFCQPEAHGPAGDYWVLRKVFMVNGGGCEGYGKTEDAAIDAARAVEQKENGK